MQYTVTIEKDPNTDWGAYVPDLPGCVAVGKTRAGVRPFWAVSSDTNRDSLVGIGCLRRLSRITSGSQANSLPHNRLATKFGLWLAESDRPPWRAVSSVTNLRQLLTLRIFARRYEVWGKQS